MESKLNEVVKADVAALVKAQESYGDSWKRRGGVGAFMMLARKWDRLENQVSAKGWDIFKAAQDDTRPEGIIDDIRDLRRYLILVEAELSGHENAPKTGVVNHHFAQIDGHGAECARCGMPESKLGLPFCIGTTVRFTPEAGPAWWGVLGFVKDINPNYVVVDTPTGEMSCSFGCVEIP